MTGGLPLRENARRALYRFSPCQTLTLGRTPARFALTEDQRAMKHSTLPAAAVLSIAALFSGCDSDRYEAEERFGPVQKKLLASADCFVPFGFRRSITELCRR